MVIGVCMALLLEFLFDETSFLISNIQFWVSKLLGFWLKFWLGIEVDVQTNGLLARGVGDWTVCGLVVGVNGFIVLFSSIIVAFSLVLLTEIVFVAKFGVKLLNKLDSLFFMASMLKKEPD